MRGATASLVLATIMITSMVAMPLGGAIATVDAQTSGPSGMVALGSDQIHEDLPDDADTAIDASDLDGAVYAADHADTLDITLTTPEKADEYLENANVLADDDVAIVLSDDEVHEGRDVAVDADVLEAGLGYLPSVAFGTHSSGAEWHSEIDVESGVGVFHVPEFSSNSVTFSGGIELTGTEAADGTSYQYDLDSLDGIDDYEIDLEGARETEERSVSSTTDEGTIDVEPRGTSDPESAVMTLEGLQSEEPTSASGTLDDGETDSFDVGGNNEPESAEVTLSADYSESTNTGSGTAGTSGVSESYSSGLDPDVDISADSVDIEYVDEGFYQRVGGDYDNSFTTTVPLGDDVSDGTVFDFDLGWSSTSDYEMDVYIEGVKVETFTRDDDGSFDLYENEVETSGHTSSIEVEFHVTSYTQGDFGDDNYLDIDGLRTDGEGPSSLDISHAGGSDSISPGSSTSFTTESGTDTIDLSADEGSIDYDITITERDGVKDPSVSVGSSTVSHSGMLDGSTTETIDLSTGSETIDASYSGESSGLDYDLTWTEVTTPQNPTLDLAGESVVHSGELADGETVSEPVSLDTGETYAADVDSDGPVKASVEWTDVSETVDPTISVNGYTTSYDGTLGPGETTSLATNEAWLEEGTNTVEISMADAHDGPDPLVDFAYRHAAASASQEVDVEATSWSESFNVSNTFVSETQDANAVLTFDERVVEIDDLELRENGGEWTTPAESEYDLNGTDLHVDLGDVAADTEIDVRATGHKIRTYDGDVDIPEPTVEGDDLATEVEIADVDDEGRFGLRVDGTALGDRIHYASDRSWSGEDAHAEVTASGTQILRADDANAGSTMTVSSTPIELDVESGAIEMEVEEAGDEPRFQLRRGETVGTDAVDVTYHDTISGERYALWSETRDVEVDADRASSPVYFTTDGDSETYSILQRDASAGEDPAPGPTDTRDSLSLVVVFGGLAGVLIGTTVVGRRVGVGGRLLPITATSLTLIAIHVFAPTSPIERVAVLAYQSDIVAVGAVGLLLLGLWQLDERTSGEIPLPVWLAVGGLAVLWALETLSPGVVLGGLREGFSTMAPLLIGGLLIGGGVLVRNWLRARREEATTPDTQVTIDGFGDGGDGGD